MADRIVVMNQGAIEQVGTPQEIYREPATPFVADFVGKINFLPGDCARAATACRSARSRFDCPRTASRPGATVQHLPPARGRAGRGRPRRRHANASTAEVDELDFLGAFCRVTCHGRRRSDAAAGGRLLAQRPGRARRPQAGDTLRVALPPDRLRVFAAPREPRPAVDARAPCAAPAAARCACASHWTDRIAPRRCSLRGRAGARSSSSSLPLAAMLAKALQDRDGDFVGLANFVTYFPTPALFQSDLEQRLGLRRS